MADGLTIMAGTSCYSCDSSMAECQSCPDRIKVFYGLQVPNYMPRDMLDIYVGLDGILWREQSIIRKSML
jgi:hypothetical protein